MKHNLAGKTFNRLTVIEYHSKRKNKHYYLCKCICGNEKVIESYNIRSGHAKSCGCLNREIVSSQKVNYRHGMSKTRIHNIWWGIIERCTNENDQAYPNYGGRGITICDEWLNDFEAFEEWAMANGYSEKLSIDRIDNDGNYEPNNCRWATRKQQNNNKSNNVRIEINGEIKNLTQWAEYAGIHRSTIYRRMKRGITGPELIQKKAIQ